MYFPTGSPEIYHRNNPSSFPCDPSLSIAFNREKNLLVDVALNSLHIWSAGKNRLLLASLTRSTGIPGHQEGISSVSWNYDSSKVAILNINSTFVEVYHIKKTDDRFLDLPLPKWLETATETPETCNAIHKVQILHHRNIILNGHHGTCLTSTKEHLVVGCFSGEIMLISWKNEVTMTFDPFQVTGSKNSSNLLSRGACISIDVHEMENYHLFSICFSDGEWWLVYVRILESSIQVLATHSSISNEKKEKKRMNENNMGIKKKASLSKIHPDSGMVVVGYKTGVTCLYEIGIAHQDFVEIQVSYLRDFSMIPWGFQSDDLCTIGCLQWTHDGQAIAIGMKHRGLIVFSLSGCKLMCTFSQHMGEEKKSAEFLRYGVRSMSWGAESFSLMVVGNNETQPCLESKMEESTSIENQNPVKLEITSSFSSSFSSSSSSSSLMRQFACTLIKDEDGLCLCLSGEPGRYGCWIRDEKSFVPRRNGNMGPAEATGLLEGGDILLAINGKSILSLTFEQAIQELREVPFGSVELQFLRLEYEEIFKIIQNYPERIDLLLKHATEEENVWEHALRMQALHGDCNQEKPSFTDFEARSKFDAWMTLADLDIKLAMIRYVRWIISLVKPWDPIETTKILTIKEEQEEIKKVKDDRSSNKSQEQQQFKKIDNDTKNKNNNGNNKGNNKGNNNGNNKGLETDDFDSENAFTTPKTPKTPNTPNTPNTPTTTLSQMIEFSFLKSSLSCDEGISDQWLLGSDRLQVFRSSPWCPTSLVNQSVPIPSAFIAANWPLRILRSSVDGQKIALAGSHGLALYNMITRRWRLFGNVHQEREITCVDLVWWDSDFILLLSNMHNDSKNQHILMLPRDHLDNTSLLLDEALPYSEIGPMHLLQRCTKNSQLYCLGKDKLLVYSMKLKGTYQERSSLSVSISFLRQIPLTGGLQSYHISTFTVLSRLDEIKKSSAQDKNSNGWFSGWYNLLGTENSNSSSCSPPPRFGLLDSNGTFWVFDPSCGTHRRLVTSVSRIIQFNCNHLVSIPKSLQVYYAFYGANGFQLWFPKMDGVYWNTRNLPLDDKKFVISALTQFYLCQDPSKLQHLQSTLKMWYNDEDEDDPSCSSIPESSSSSSSSHPHSSSSSCIPESSSLKESNPNEKHQKKHQKNKNWILEDIYSNYGISLVDEESAAGNLVDCSPDATNYLCLVDHPIAKDTILDFNFEMSLLGMHSSLGVGVGVCQDVYIPTSGHDLQLDKQCFDLRYDIQPVAHSVIRFLLQTGRRKCAEIFLDSIQTLPLFSLCLELLLYSILEDVYSKIKRQIPLSIVSKQDTPLLDFTVQILRKYTTFHEVLVRTARKVEPSRLSLLFSCCGNPEILFKECIKKGELHTASNLLLLLHDTALEQPSPETFIKENPRHVECAMQLLDACLISEEYKLAHDILRLAKGWNKVSEQKKYIESFQSVLEKHAFRLLYQLQFQNVVLVLRDFGANLPVGQQSSFDPQIVQQEIVKQFSFELISLMESKNVVQEESKKKALQLYFDNRDSLKFLLGAVMKAKYGPWVSLIQNIMQVADRSAAQCTRLNEDILF